MKTWIGRLLSNYKKKESLSEQAEGTRFREAAVCSQRAGQDGRRGKTGVSRLFDLRYHAGNSSGGLPAPQSECIVQMAGLREGNAFYFDLVSDSGIHATYQAAMCEKDHEYADHLCTRLSEYYEIPAGRMTVSQIHKHRRAADVSVPATGRPTDPCPVSSAEW